MKVDVTQILKQRTGESLKDSDGAGSVIEADLRRAIINALEAPLEKDKTEQPIEKYKRSKLADKVFENDEVDFTVDEIAMIKDRIGRVFQSYVVKVCWDLLEKS